MVSDSLRRCSEEKAGGGEESRIVQKKKVARTRFQGKSSLSLVSRQLWSVKFTVVDASPRGKGVGTFIPRLSDLL